MGINTDFLKKRLNQLQSKRNVQSNIWKPTSGETRIRIVPYKFNRENPFIELYWHYGFNNKNYVSPFSFGDPDPIQEFAEKLKSTGESDDWKNARALEPKLRTYVPIIVRGEEEEGVKYWGFGIKIYEALLKLISDPEWGDITHPNAGRDITVEFKTAKELKKDYPETTIRVSPSQTKLTSEAKELKKFLNDQIEITQVYVVSTYDELKKELDLYLNGPTAEEESVDEATSTPELEDIEDSTDDDLDSVMDDFDSLVD